MTPWVRRIVLANVVVFLLTSVAAGGVVLANLMALHTHLLLILRQPWSPITYMFVHANFMHIFFNMLVLFVVGPHLETRLGGGRFLKLYFVSGVTGALLSLLFAVGRPVQIVGASGAVYGMAMAYAVLWPRNYFFGIIPSRWLVGFLVVAAIYNGFSGVQDGVAHFAHLGGFLGGYLYTRHQEQHSPHQKFKELSYAADRRRPEQDSQDVYRWGNIQAESLHEVNRDEVERLQAKIRDVGVADLTLDERAFLNRFSAPRH